MTEEKEIIGGLTAGIVGSRTFDDRAIVRRTVQRLMNTYGWVNVVSGASPSGGADTLAREVCEELGFHMCDIEDRTVGGALPCYKESAWHFYERKPRAHNKAAYFARNTEIARDSQILFAFYSPGPRSPGTTDTVTKAKARPIPVHIYHEGRWS